MSKKDMIKDASIKLIARDGYFNATTDKISKEASVAVGTIYNYFSSKEEILNYIFDTELQKRYDFYNNMKNWHMDWFLKINGILNFHLQEMRKEPDISKIILSEKINAHRYNMSSLIKFSQLSLIISDILQQGINEEKIRSCDVKIISLIISGFLDAITYEFATTDDFDNIEYAIDEFCTLLKNGLVTL
ncbi:MAG: TetR/AcrR family transcriptional regulator [Clostridia bacterium]|nr:TetR/AcrR family transcriptional regulator [Clostridia bacterium]MDD4048370.1 TetR/AcrR family transcriptional regulator [Clostridia bacterium]